jgi:uncharacterized membrane protein
MADTDMDLDLQPGASRERAPQRRPPRRSPLALGLGGLSVGLGLAELLAPRGLARLAGLRGRGATPGVLRGLGAREVAVGLGLLFSRRPTPWLWARVVGDVVDLALLAVAARERPARRSRTAGAFGVLAGVTALDVTAAISATRTARARRAEPVRGSITIARRPEEVYRYWRDLGHAPDFMSRIESVEVLDARRSRWSARGPVGPVLSWEAEVVEEIPNSRLAWRSIEGSDIRTTGSVRFLPAPGDRGTEVHLELGYGSSDGLGGGVGAFLAKAVAAPVIEGDLRRLKQLLETGHIVHSDASAHKGRHPARPSSAPAAGDAPTGGAS